MQHDPYSLFRSSTFGAGTDRARRAVEELDRFGLPWRDGRFAAYASVLEEVAQMTMPPNFPEQMPFEGEIEKQVLLYEAVSQCEQLARATEDLYWQPYAPLRQRLLKVVGGDALPATDSKADEVARNTLFELATAASFKRTLGCTIVLPEEDGSDFILVLDDLAPIHVECKRPATGNALGRNMRDALKQLRQRRGRDLGLAVFGIDRLSGFAGTLTSVENDSVLQSRVNGAIASAAIDIVEAQRAMQQQLWPDASLFAIHLFCPVISGRAFVSVAVGQTFPTGSGRWPDDPSLEVQDVLKAHYVRQATRSGQRVPPPLQVTLPPAKRRTAASPLPYCPIKGEPHSGTAVLLIKRPWCWLGPRSG